MKSLHLIKRVSSLFVLLLVVSACSKEDPLLDDIDGSYSLDISGDVTESWEGDANYLQIIKSTGTDEEKGTILTITLTQDDENSVVIQLIKLETASFSEGTYQFIEDPSDNDVGLLITMYHAGSVIAYFPTSGQVQLSKIKDTMVEGSFSVDMINGLENSVSVSGTFKARGLTQNI